MINRKAAVSQTYDCRTTLATDLRFYAPSACGGGGAYRFAFVRPCVCARARVYVCVCECAYVKKFCPEHISKTIQPSLMKLDMLIELYERKCSDQDLQLCGQSF